MFSLTKTLHSPSTLARLDIPIVTGFVWAIGHLLRIDYSERGSRYTIRAGRYLAEGSSK